MVMLMPRKAGPPRPYRALGEAIAEARHRKGMRQWDLADAAHISRSYPGVIERGQNRPDPDVLRRIASVLGASYDEFARLARYANAPQGDVPIYASHETAPILERLAMYPKRILEELEVQGGRLDRLLAQERPLPTREDVEERESERRARAEHDGEAPAAGAQERA